MHCMFTCTVKGQLGLLIGLQSPGVQGEETDRVIGCHAVLPLVADSICRYTDCGAINLLRPELLIVPLKCPHLSAQGK